MTEHWARCEGIGILCGRPPAHKDRVPEGQPVPETGHSILAFGRLEFVAVGGGGTTTVVQAYMVHDAGDAMPQKAAAAASAVEPAAPTPAAAEAPPARKPNPPRNESTASAS